jgi:hypothetical protein
MRTTKRLALFVLSAACSDYDLEAKNAASGSGGEDSGTFVPEVDTAETGIGEDSGGGTIVDTADPEVASEPVYINSGSTLYSFDPATRAATAIGQFKDSGVLESGMTDIAIDLTGRMYGVAYEELYRINPTTAAITWVGTLDDSANALTFLSDGTLVAAGDGGVITVDPATMRQSKVGGRGYTSSGDIVGLPDGYLYWSVEAGSNDDLIRVDPSNGVCTRLGSIGAGGVYALGYADGELYGFTSQNKVVVIDATTGRATQTNNLSGSWWGATTNPVLW